MGEDMAKGTKAQMGVDSRMVNVPGTKKNADGKRPQMEQHFVTINGEAAEPVASTFLKASVTADRVFGAEDAPMLVDGNLQAAYGLHNAIKEVRSNSGIEKPNWRTIQGMEKAVVRKQVVEAAEVSISGLR